MSEMLDRIGRTLAILNTQRPYGMYDYSSYPGDAPPLCIRDELTNKIIARFTRQEQKQCDELYNKLNCDYAARAVLQCILNATDDMYLAGYNAGTGDFGGHYDNARELSRGRMQPAWQAMIKKALE